MINVGERVEIKGDILECVSIDCTKDYYTEKVHIDFRVVGKAPTKKETKFKVGDKVTTKYCKSKYIYNVIGTVSHNNTNWIILADESNLIVCGKEEAFIKIEDTKSEPIRDAIKKGFATYIGKKGVVRERTDIYDEEIISGICVDYKCNITDKCLLYIKNVEGEVYSVKPKHFFTEDSKEIQDLYKELLEKYNKLMSVSTHYGHVIRDFQKQLHKTSDYKKKEELTTKINEFKNKKTLDKKNFIVRYMRAIEKITNVKGNK